ncbi:MAG: Rieske (2Fe-2S) protein [Parachlamydiaceae bacterium]|nr:Rieske (2Fe-2S) protein [Parachlamydiaceae bacterium]
MAFKRIALARVKDIPEGRRILVTTPEGNEIALFKSKEEIFALGNECPHLGGPLAESEITSENCKEIVTCPWHGWQFNLRTGECENYPGDDAKKINIIVEGEFVYYSS